LKCDESLNEEVKDTRCGDLFLRNYAIFYSSYATTTSKAISALSSYVEKNAAKRYGCSELLSIRVG
jgi:predicted secreted protein